MHGASSSHGVAARPRANLRRRTARALPVLWPGGDECRGGGTWVVVVSAALITCSSGVPVSCGARTGQFLTFRTLSMAASAAFAASWTDCLPVAMFCSIVCRVCAFSTLPQPGAVGTNQLVSAAVAVTVLAGSALRVASCVLLLGRLPLP